MPVWFSLFADAGLRRFYHGQSRQWAGRLLSALLLLGVVLPMASPAFGQATPAPKSKHKAKVQARKARVKAILAVPSLPDKDTVTIAPKRPLPRAKPGQRAGSAPTPPVRNISVDPRDPVGPPPPGVRNTGQPRVPGTSHKPVPDTLARPLPGGGTALVNDTTRRGDSLQVAARPKGQIATTIKYTAKDSMQFDVTKKVARLYNKANVDYGDTDLKAALITVNYGQNTMEAEGRMDSVKNRLIDRPVLKDGASLYTASNIAYNFKSKKARVTDAVTTQGEGFVSAATIKRLPDGDINGLNGRYTTCNLEHPHFYIQAKKMKVIPGEKVVTGPFNLVIGDVPTPLGFLFGFFPMPNKSRGSGVLIPTFGQASDRGYYLTNGGYYFAPNDYIGVRLTGDIYAGNNQKFGGWGATADFSYLKRYTFNGNFNLRFSNRPTNPILLGNDGSANVGQTYIQPPSSNSFWVSWYHSPVAKPGGGRFSASVNAGTSSFNRINSLDARRYLSTQYSSSIGYSKQLRYLPINFDVKMSQAQGTDGTMTFTLPDVSVGVARQYPYQWFGIKPGAGGKLGTMLYEQFTISYNLTARNEFSNAVAPRTLSSGFPLLGGGAELTRIPFSFGNVGRLLSNGRNGMQHQFNIGVGSYSLGPHIKLNPSVSYGEVWYGQRLKYSYEPLAEAVRIDTVRGFNRIGAYSLGATLNTTVYGTVVRRGTHKIQALRHKLTPSVSYNFSPDAYTAGNYYPQNTPVYQRGRDIFKDANGNIPVTGNNRQYLTDAVLNTYSFNSYEGSLYGVPGSARQQQISFGLQNNVEMKVRDDKDTTGTSPFRKVSLIDGLDFNMSYNFAAEVRKLSDLNVQFRTQIAKKLMLTSGASFSPYQRNSQGVEIDKYLFQANNRKLLRLSSASFQTSYAFNPTTGTKKSVVRRAVAPSNDPTLGTVGPPNFYADYVDFDIPWELNLTYAAGYTTNTVPLTSSNQRPPILALNTMGATGSIKLTPNLKFSSNLSYDFVSQSMGFTSVNFSRDLHCWQITGTWFPFGQLKGYNFTIAAKSSLLQDLKLNRNRQAQYQ
ncbi:putative LPS assembly protein LptD [Hymenobacter glaciei]|uniref:LPS assembly protein LptD n=1 Tax=Hymenobacter glaciei TaxID=877209 RepID=A0ABP7TFF3_9BACT